MTIAILIAAAALPYADLDALDRAVAAFAGAATGQPGGAMTPLDRRLRLRPCAAAPVLDWRGARDAVTVKCPDPGSWKLTVPVLRPATAAANGPAVNRGDSVIVTVMGEGFSVSRPGLALEGGVTGAWIRVRTDGGAGSPGEPLRAQIRQPGLVLVPMP